MTVRIEVFSTERCESEIFSAKNRTSYVKSL